MTGKLLEHWADLAGRGDFATLAAEAAHPPRTEDRALYACYRARALQAMGQGELANEALVAAVSHGASGTVKQLAELAEELLQACYFDLAARLAGTVDQHDPRFGAYLSCCIHREREDWAAFTTALARLRSVGGEPWSFLAVIQEAWVNLRRGRAWRADQIMAPHALSPRPAVQKLMIKIDLALGRQIQAKARLEHVAQLQPLDWEWPALSAVALIMEGQGDADAEQYYARVAEQFQTSLARQPRQPEALLNRARWALSLGRVEQGRQDCKLALSCKPWLDGPVLLWVENALQRRDFDEAERLLASARQSLDTPRRAAAVLDLARIRGGKVTDLINMAHDWERRYPDDTIVLRSVGAALQAARRPMAAVGLYERILQLDPDDSETRNNLAILYREQGDLDQALVVWGGMTGPVSDAIRLNQAHVILGRGDQIQAEALFDHVLARDPDNPSALRGRAEVEFGKGNNDKAISLAEQALRTDSANPLAWLTCARIWRRVKGDRPALDLLVQGLEHARPVLQLQRAIFGLVRQLASPAEVNKLVDDWCQASPHESALWLMAAEAAYDQGEFNRCESLLRRAFEADPDTGGEALIRFYTRRERMGAARRIAEQMIRSEPERGKNWGLLAEVLYEQDRLDEALEALERGLKRDPSRLSLVRMRVGILLSRERFDEAIQAAWKLWYQENKPPHLLLLLDALKRGQRYDDAVSLLETLLATGRQDIPTCLNYAQFLGMVGRHDDSLQVFSELYGREPLNFDIVRSYVQMLASQSHLAKGLAILEEFVGKSGGRPDLVASVAELLVMQGEWERAQDVIHRALMTHPDSLDLWLGKVRLQRDQNDSDGERATWRAILTRFPARQWWISAIPHLVRLGLIQPMEDGLNVWRAEESANPAPWWAAYRAAKEMKNYGIAYACLDRLENLRGKSAEIHAKRADLLQDEWRMTEAMAEIGCALALRPKEPAYHAVLLNNLVKAGDFDRFDEVMEKLERALGDHKYHEYRNFFFNINCHPTWSAAQTWRYYRDWYERVVKPGRPPAIPHQNNPDPDRRLKVGYLSPDFRRHAVAYFSEPLMIGHDREQFELFAYAHLDPGGADSYTERFRGYFDHWIEIRSMTDAEVARRIRADGIDILVDLAGHTANNRLATMLHRPAPVQASWIWGAGQTSGIPEVDVFLTDRASVPPEHDQFMAERVVRMAQAGLPFKPATDVLEPTPLPCLENGFVTFVVMARPLRTNRQSVALWARILHGVPGSILRFDHVPYAESDVQARLAGYFAEHGIGADRLRFLNTRPHWQVYQDIDIQLDPFPAGSGTTASEGLYMDRLVVTLKSRPPMGLIVHGQLEAMGLDDLCAADTAEDYVAKAVALASDQDRLASLSHGLRKRFEQSWLMDYQGYGREVGSIYRRLWREWCESKDRVPPSHILPDRSAGLEVVS